MTQMCRSVYHRQWRNEKGLSEADIVLCTYLKDHPTDRHSWWALKVQDQCDEEAVIEEQVERVWSLNFEVPKNLLPLVEAIAAGYLDEHLEVILSAAHGRKRGRRMR
jgi:hypothetical protein